MNLMDDLTVEEIIAFHEQVMKTDGRDARLLSEASLHQMVFSANRTEDVHHRAALAFFTLCAYPAFRDGNKRTALLLARTILIRNGYLLEQEGDGMAGLMQGIASFTVEEADVEEWLHSHSHKKQPDIPIDFRQ